MKKYNKIMTALDLSELDDLLVPYMNKMAKALGSKTIYGAHVIPVFLIPNIIKLDPANNFMPTAPAVEKIREAVFNEIKTQLGETDMSIHIKIEEGRPFSKLLKMVKDADPDLLIFGKKNKSEGSGITARRVAHNIDTDILLVPDEAHSEIKKILVPVDFSENSYRALEFAQGFQERLGLGKKVEVLFVVDTTPLEQYKGYEIYDDFNKMLPRKAEDQYQEFLKHYGVDESTLHVNYVKTNGKNIASTALDFAEENGYDFFVVGAKGHSLFQNFIFGSVTETLMEVDTKILIMVVR